MSIMDLFRNKPADQQSTQQTQQPDIANLGTQNNGVTAPNGTTPTQTTDQSPLAQFKDLWEPVKDAAGNPVAPASENERYINIDPAKVMESAKKVDFAKMIDPAHFQAISQGGDAAVSAMAAIVNTLGQTLYAQSAITSANLTEQSLGNASARFEASVPDLIKRHQVSDSLRTENPLFSNPAAQPMLQMLESQLTAKYPNATVADIKKSAQDYLAGFATELTGGPNSSTAKPAAVNPAEDWEAFSRG